MAIVWVILEVVCWLAGDIASLLEKIPVIGKLLAYVFRFVESFSKTKNLKKLK
jgi:hypothetical protein